MRTSNRLSSVQFLRGIGPKRAVALEGIGIRTVNDLLFYFPRGYLDRSTIVPISQLSRSVSAGEPVTVIGEVYRREARRSKRSNRVIFFLTLRDETGFAQCVWFEGIKYYKDAFEQGETIAVSAVPTLDRLGRPQFVHPEFDRLRGSPEEEEPDWGKMINTGAIIPKYSSTSELGAVGLDSRGFRRIIRTALRHHLDEVTEILPPSVLKRQQLSGLSDALRAVHFPADREELQSARRRLKFDELFFLQLMLGYRRRKEKEPTGGISFSVESPLARKLVDSLPFSLTQAQKRVIKEIASDMRASTPMNRLLQGDVGSGKTIVALTAMLVAVDNGYQGAFMAPTEVLAEQHFRTITSFIQNLPVTVRLLIGGQKKKLREEILEDVRAGRANIVVGTHALLEGTVEFATLGLAVIDEQHRFGVLQRATLRSKGLNPDVLVMTATPIPRTLAMSVYGDLDVSVIDEMPAHRKPVRTAVRLEHQKEKVFDFLRQEVHHGRQAYVVFPLIEESEKIDLKAATKEFEHLKNDIFPRFRLGLLHGRLKSEQKDEVMQKFKAAEIQILAATTVIEVGIDVPNATVMVIENAERFGLSQLHQLRGRVGRGADQSYCILIADYAWFDHRKKGRDADFEREKRQAKVRLETMVETTDGFRIAEIDLQLRGPGEMFGTRQSGLPEFKIADLLEDEELMKKARKEAFEIVGTDPELRLPEHAAVKAHFQARYRNQWELSVVG
ncbi:MAG: ATP-dependent DNA helicase RecG [Ignavibacteriales bacterium]|nr:ATP-dependent DNA helicase RecG [Ignavibacteriales bacterium]